MKAKKLIGIVREPNGTWVIEGCPMQADGETKRKKTTQDDCAKCEYSRMVLDNYTLCLYDEIKLMREQEFYASI